MNTNRKRVLVLIFAVLHLVLFTFTYLQLGFSTIKAENVLTDGGLLENQGDQLSYNFTLPANVLNVTISVYGDLGTDFDLSDIQNPTSSQFSYYSQTRDSDFEEITIDYPYEGNWNFNVNYPYDGSGVSGNFLVYVDYNLITDSEPNNTVLSVVDQLDTFGSLRYYFSTPQNATRVAIRVLSTNADISIGDVTGRYFSDYIYSINGDNQYLEITNPEYQEWSIDIYSDATQGGFQLLVYYEVAPEPSADVYQISDTISDHGSNFHSFDFYGNAEKLVISLITQEANFHDLSLNVTPPSGPSGSSDSPTTFYKTVVIDNPPEGTYNITVNETNNWSAIDYEIKVFTEDFTEHTEVVAPTITGSSSNTFTDATTANLSIDINAGDDMLLVFASYKSYGISGLWNNYLSYIGDAGYYDQFRKYESYPKCYSVLENLPDAYDMSSEVWYFNGELTEGTFNFDFTFQGSQSDIRDLILTAVTLTNTNENNFQIDDYACQAKGDANTTDFNLLLNSKPNDIVLGAIYTDQNITFNPSYGNTLHSHSNTGYGFTSTSDTTTDLQWYTLSPVTKYTAVAVSIRGEGPTLSPNSYTFVPGPSAEDLENPEINFTKSPGAAASDGVEFEGTVTDDVAVDYAEYVLNGGQAQSVGLSGTLTEKSFDFNISGLSTGSNTVDVTAYDVSGKFVSQSFTFDYIEDYEVPFCDLTSQPSVVNSNTVTYSNISCTDDVGINQLQLIVTRDNLFTEIYNGYLPATVAQDGDLGDIEEIITFTIPIELPDGIIFVKLNPVDAASKTATFVGSDFFTVEAEDTTAPTLYLEAIRPDPTMDDSPRITGSCSDNSLYDTNSVISEMRYRLDAGTWEPIIPFDSTYGGSTEAYSFDPGALSIGVHTIEVECTDSQSLVATKSDEFEVIPPVDSEPQIITETEDFNDHTNHVLSESNLIWGNGKLRLRETISTVRTSIDLTNYPTKYQNTGYNRYLIQKDPSNSNIIWYSRTGEIVSYNISNNASTLLNPLDWGLSGLSTPIQSIKLSVLNGKTYLWVADLYRLQVYNLTDNQAVEISIYELGDIAPDNLRGRLAAYAVVQGNIRYIDLNGTLTNTSDDTNNIVASAPSGSSLSVHLDASRNELYFPRYGIGLARLNDNNTPSNFGDDILAEYSNGQFENNGSVFGILVDPNGYLLVGMAGYNQTGGLYVVLDSHTTPENAADDTVLKLADSAQIKNLNIYGITYLEGNDGVGDQLFLRGELGDAYYLNFNDTYTDLLDDTYIRLKITTDNRGVDTNSAYRGSAELVVTDYNTLYVNGDIDGFQRYDLLRGWEDAGQAVVYSTPEDRLFANYFELRNVEDVGSITVANQINLKEEDNIFNKIKNLFFPQVTAQQLNGSVTYSVSVDDGVTWTPITLEDILNMTQNDYRVKFRVEMTELNSSTPVIDSYTLAFGAYQDEEQADVYTLDLNALPNTATTADDLTFTAKIIDELGFTNSEYNGGLVINLIDSVTSTVRNTLINYSNLTLTDGEFTTNNLRITEPGTYYITAIYNNVAYFSNLITINNAPVSPVPSINFTSNRYTINLGESVTLSWDTENLASLSINRGIGALNTLDGTINISPSSTTAYTLSGTGPYGDLEVSLTITVIQPTPTVNPITPVPGDTDNDGLTDEEEVTLGTNPEDSDSDDDGLLDGEEVDGCLYTEGTVTCSVIVFGPTEPLNPNTDDDSLLDGEEVRGCYFQVNTTICSSQVFDPTDPLDLNSPAILPVATTVELPTENVAPTVDVPEVAEPGNIITQIFETVSTTAKSGTLPTALVLTTTTATALTAVAYPNFIPYAFLWLRRKKKSASWGLVYNYTNNKPVAFVTVRILNGNNEFVAEEISDLNGKYSIVAKPGTYNLVAKVNDYQEYKTEINVVEDVVNIEIPLIPKAPEYDRKIIIRNWLKVNLPKINAAVFYIGFIFATITVIIAPNLVNFVILTVFIIQSIIYYWIGRGKTGKIFDLITGEVLKGVFVRVYEKESGRQLGSVSTDENGKYNIFLKPGKYLIKVESFQYQLSKTISNGMDAVGVPYTEAEIKKDGLLDISIPMERKSNADLTASTTGKFGYLS